MCGFFISNNKNIGERHLSIINSRLSFRGPDFQSSLIQHKGWNIYHARLSIIAEQKDFSQPYRTKSGGVLVFNGEILNYKILAKKYHIYDDISDTHVLSELLELKEFDLNELEGFFAFVLIDKFGKILRGVRDRFGVKPLFYHKTSKSISFASEASILSDLYDLPYCEFAIQEYRAFRAPVFSGSYFKNIYSVDPGTCIVCGEYFNSLSFIPEAFGKATELVSDLRQSITESVSSRLIADVPVGLLYSGGIDSNLIKLSSEQDLMSFTGGFDGDFDIEYAKSINHANLAVCLMDNDNFVSRLKEMIKLRKEPLSVPNEVILSILADEWKRLGGKVLLSGEAADEFFAGYDRIYTWALQTDNFTVEDFLQYYCYIRTELVDYEIKERVHDFFEGLEGLSSFEKVRQFFVKKHLPVLFRRLDFALMFAGVEGREPLASLELYKLALKFNPNDLFRNSLGKYPLRVIAAELKGHEFAFKPKVGFPIDANKIFYNKPSKNRFENYSTWCNKNLELAF